MLDTSTHMPDNFFAGGFPVAKDFGDIKADAKIRKYAPLVKGASGIEEASATTLGDLVGIAADEPEGGKVVYYLTGEFFAQALAMPAGVTAAVLKPAFRKLGIFLKERN